MTGRHPGHAFIRDNRQAKAFDPKWDEGQTPVPAGELTFPLTLKKLGYTLGGFGKWGLGPVGSTGDGMFGITYAVQGSMSQPQVLVNPFSLVAPGIFRDIFQMTNPNPKVIPRDEKGPALPIEKRVRASSPGSSDATHAPSTPTAGTPGSADGWSSQVAPSKTPPH